MKTSLGRTVWAVSGIAFFAFLLFPLLILVAVSVDPQAMVFPPRGFSLKWYVLILEKEDFISSAWSSTTVALLTAIISTTAGTFAAIGLHRHANRWRGMIQGALLSPLFFPAVIVALALFQLMLLLGLTPSLWLLVCAHVVVTMPYPIRNVLAQLSSFNGALEEAAMVVGATPRQALVRVTLPLLKHSIVPSFILVFILSWNNFTVSVFLAGQNWITLPLQLRAYLQYEYEPFIAAMSTVLIVVSATLLFIVERAFGSLRRAA
jgi:putative spermidine/putrescine transport system permease protein